MQMPMNEPRRFLKPEGVCRLIENPLPDPATDQVRIMDVRRVPERQQVELEVGSSLILQSEYGDRPLSPVTR